MSLQATDMIKMPRALFEREHSVILTAHR
jgi:hypothetical protein